MLTLLGFAALVIDLGYARSSDAKLDAVAEAAAMGGATELDGTVDGITAAENGSIFIASLNTVDNDAVALTPDDVTVGIWDPEAKEFTPSEDLTEENALLVNAVQVLARKDDVATFFSQVTFGVTEMSVAGRSVVQRGDLVGTGSADCFLPIALPDCYFDQDDDDVETMVLKLQPAGIDNAGWGRMNAAWDNTYNRDQITDSCSAGTGYVGDQVYLGNGIATSSLQKLDDVLEASTTTWDTDTYGAEPPQLSAGGVVTSTLTNWGNTLEGPIILFDDDSYCSDSNGDGAFDGGSFTGNKTTTGFAWGVIFDVAEKGDAATRNLQMHIDLTGEHHVGSSAGGTNYNVTFIGNSKEVL